MKADSWEASIWKNEATASVIMAKKIARTRSDSRPMANASARLNASAMLTPSAIFHQVGPSFAAAMATP